MRRLVQERHRNRHLEHSTKHERLAHSRGFCDIPNCGDHVPDDIANINVPFH